MTTRVPASRVPFVDKDGIATPYMYRFMQTFFNQNNTATATLAAASFLTVAAEGGLGANRTITPATGQLTGTDAGGKSTYTLGLANTAVTPNTYGTASSVGQFTVDAKGRLTSAGNVTIAITASQVSGVALTATNDTNVTLTLGGTPGSALVATASLTLGWSGTLAVSRGGSGVGTLTGYVKGNGTSAFTASATVPNTDVTGLGTMATQNASAVAITGGNVDGTPIGATTPAAITGTTVRANTSFILKGSGTGTTTISSANSSATNYTITMPAITDTLVTLTASQTLTNKTLASPIVTGTLANSDPATSMYNYDTSGNAQSLVANATLDFTSMSGMIIANDNSAGSLTIYLCSGGLVTVVASANGQAGTMAYNAGTTAYRFTNNSGATHTFSFFVLRTRNSP